MTLPAPIHAPASGDRPAPTEGLSRPDGPRGRPPADLARRGAQLPRWPVLAMLAGLPAWWVLGLHPFTPGVFALLMTGYLLAQPQIRLTPGVAPYLVFALWCPASVVMLDTPMRWIGFLIRWSAIVAGGLLLLYITNSASHRLRDLDVLSALAVIWGLAVVGGYLGMLWPHGRLTTPMAQVLPGPLVANEYIRDLVLPRFAEVQRPWGAPEAFNRPAAPFPYTNGWGCAVALLTPVMLSLRERLAHPVVRWAIIAGLAASVIPAVQTANRGMLLVLGAEIAWYLLIQAFRGRVVVLVRAMLGAAVAAAALGGLGLFGLIAERQSYSDTTSGRASVYAQTWQELQRSPILGFGGPRPSPEIGISLGTQGAIWTYLFSYGLVGGALFLAFLLGVLTRSGLAGSPETTASPGTTASGRPPRTTGDTAWWQSVMVGALVACWFYGFDGIHLGIIAAIAALLLRARHASSRPAREPAGVAG